MAPRYKLYEDKLHPPDARTTANRMGDSEDFSVIPRRAQAIRQARVHSVGGLFMH